MNKISKYIIIYSKEETDANYFGFSIMEGKKASQFMKAVEKLSEEGCPLSINDNTDVSYESDDFVKIKMNPADLSVLQKIFDVDNDEEPIGIFPNAINDAYDNGLFEENEEDPYDE